MGLQKFRFDDNFTDALFIDSNIPEKQTIDYIREKSIEKIIINSENGFSGNSIESFCQLKEIKSIELVLYYEDISCIQKMDHLEELAITHSEPLVLNFSAFTNLKELSYDWSKTAIGLSTCKELTSLGISKYKGMESELAELKKLKSLSLSEGTLKSLDFLISYNSLRKLDISYLYKMEDVSGLISVVETLEELEISACKNIRWNEELPKLKNLKKLILSGFKFENIEFVRKLPNLEHFSFWGSNILNGDVSPAKDIRFVSFDNRKHYNYQYDAKKMKVIPK